MLKLHYKNFTDKYWVIGLPEAIFHLWFLLKDNPNIYTLKVFNLDGYEVDPKRGLDILISEASYN